MTARTDVHAVSPHRKLTLLEGTKQRRITLSVPGRQGAHPASKRSYHGARKTRNTLLLQQYRRSCRRYITYTAARPSHVTLAAATPSSSAPSADPHPPHAKPPPPQHGRGQPTLRTAGGDTRVTPPIRYSQQARRWRMQLLEPSRRTTRRWRWRRQWQWLARRTFGDLEAHPHARRCPSVRPSETHHARLLLITTSLTL